MHQSHLAVAKTRLAPPFSSLDTNGSFQGKKGASGFERTRPLRIGRGARRRPAGAFRKMESGAAAQHWRSFSPAGFDSHSKGVRL